MSQLNKRYELLVTYEFNYDEILNFCKENYITIDIPDDILDYKQLTNAIIILTEAKFFIKIKKHIFKIINSIGDIYSFKIVDDNMLLKFKVKNKYNTIGFKKYPFLENELDIYNKRCISEIKHELIREFGVDLPVNYNKINYVLNEI
jgi:hypothetical protein